MPRNANTAWWAMRIDPDLRAEIDADRQAKGQTLSEWSVRAARLALANSLRNDPNKRLAEVDEPR